MRIAVCGAGIAGLAFALAATRRGSQVVLLENAAAPRRQGYMMDFFGPGYDAAEALGLVPKLRQLDHRIAGVRYVDQSGRRRATLDFGPLVRKHNTRLLNLTRADLELVLRESLPANVQVRFSTTITAIDQDGSGVNARLSSGQNLRVDLLVGADGIHSRVRRLTFGDESHYLRRLGFDVVAFTFADATTRSSLDQWYYTSDSIDASLSLYPLDQDNVGVFGLHKSIDTQPSPNHVAALEAAYGHLGWLVPRVLSHAPGPDEFYQDVVAQLLLPAWSQGRVVLIGDACHAVSPLGGQGAGLAVAGGLLLADELAEQPTIGAALHAYENRWRPEVDAVQRGARRLAPWFVPHDQLHLLIRRLALNTAALPGVRGVVGSLVVPG